MQEFEKLVEILENYVEVDEITPDDDFRIDLDMSSFDTMCFVTDVKSALDVELTVSDFIEHKTVGEMAEYIASVKK